MKAKARWLDQRADGEWAIPIKIREHPGENVLLQRGYVGDAGFDLIASQSTPIRVGSYAEVPCGFDIEMPGNLWALIHSRSSTLRDRRLLVMSSVIDQGYRGPMFVGAWNLGDTRAVVERGERIAQLIPMPLLSSELAVLRVKDLTPSDRGSKGFGSTGK